MIINARKHRRFIWPALLLILITGAAISLWTAAKIYYPIKYRETVTRYSAEYSVPADLIYAVIHSESGYRPDAVSSVGARGLMQITEDTFDWAKWRLKDTETVYDDMFNPENNIRYGTYILSLLIGEFGSTETALAAYHAGRGSVNKWLADKSHSTDGKTLCAIPFKDTAGYVPKVMNTKKIYNRLYNNEL